VCSSDLGARGGRPGVQTELPLFFRAEDGIRAFHVTGVQTCALPIYPQRDLLAARDRIQQPIGDREIALALLRRAQPGHRLGGRADRKSVVEGKGEEDRLPRLGLENRGVAKRKSTYTDKLPQTTGHST